MKNRVNNAALLNDSRPLIGLLCKFTAAQIEH